jgi:hypothetical protein
MNSRCALEYDWQNSRDLHTQRMRQLPRRCGIRCPIGCHSSPLLAGSLILPALCWIQTEGWATHCQMECLSLATSCKSEAQVLVCVHEKQVAPHGMIVASANVLPVMLPGIQIEAMLQEENE